MKVFVLMWVCFYLLYAQGMNQKMVISAHADTSDAADDLYTLETFFEENSQARILKEKHHLTFEMELLEPYVLVTIIPITSGDIKNKLRYLLQSSFPQNFVVDNSPMQSKPIVKASTTTEVAPVVVKTVSVEKKTEVVLPSEKDSKDSMDISKKLQELWSDLESEWLGLIFLALAGFLLVYRSAKQMNKIKHLQEEVTQYQSKVEGEIKYMGEKDA